jgi:hypothetical protein
MKHTIDTLIENIRYEKEEIKKYEEWLNEEYITSSEVCHAQQKIDIAYQRIVSYKKAIKILSRFPNKNGKSILELVELEYKHNQKIKKKKKKGSIKNEKS